MIQTGEVMSLEETEEGAVKGLALILLQKLRNEMC